MIANVELEKVRILHREIQRRRVVYLYRRWRSHNHRDQSKRQRRNDRQDEQGRYAVHGRIETQVSHKEHQMIVQFLTVLVVVLAHWYTIARMRQIERRLRHDVIKSKI